MWISGGDLILILGTLIRSGTAGGVGAFLSRSVQSFYVCFLSRGVPAAREARQRIQRLEEKKGGAW